MYDSNSLQHYGIVGMKWGKHRASSNRKQYNKLSKEHNKLDKRLSKEDKKASEYEAVINKARRKVERKMAFTFKASKLNALSEKLDALDEEVLKAQRPVKAIQAQMERNVRMRSALDKTLDNMNKRYDEKFFKEITKLDKEKDASKIDAMTKEREKYKEKNRI